METHALDPPALRDAFAAARTCRYPRGEVVVHEGDPGDVHLVTSGWFAARAASGGGDVVVALFGKEDLFGLSGGTSRQHRQPFTVVALEESATLALPQREFADGLDGGPATDAFLGAMGRDLDRRARRLVDAIAASAEQRLIHVLSELVEGNAGTVRMSQADLAAIAGTSRATANRLLREEQRRGSIRISRSRIDVLDAEVLAERAAT